MYWLFPAFNRNKTQCNVLMSSYREKNKIDLFSFFLVFFFSNLANCQSPGDINHGLKFGNNYKHGKAVRYFCNLGYTLEGEAELTCEDGRWNTDTPKCKGKRWFLFLKLKKKASADFVGALTVFFFLFTTFEITWKLVSSLKNELAQNFELFKEGLTRVHLSKL